MSIGWGEIVFVMILALIVFGPKRLPEIGRQVGRAIREVRRVSNEFETEVRTAMAIDETPPAKPLYDVNADHSRYITPPSEPPATDTAPDDPPRPTA